MNKETIEIPLRKATYEELQEVICELQVERYIKDKENERLNNIISELEYYIKRYLYMLNGITDKDIYEQCQLDDFTDIMEKLKELKDKE